MPKQKKQNNVQFRQTGTSTKAVAALIIGIATMIVFLVLVLYSGIKEETLQYAARQHL